MACGGKEFFLNKMMRAFSGSKLRGSENLNVEVRDRGWTIILWAPYYLLAGRQNVCTSVIRSTLAVFIGQIFLENGKVINEPFSVLGGFPCLPTLFRRRG
jgi:hypothetical protein